MLDKMPERQHIFGMKHPLEKYRAGRDMSQADLARFLKVGRANISRWESGHRRPRLDECLRIAKLTGIEPGALLFGDGYGNRT